MLAYRRPIASFSPLQSCCAAQPQEEQASSLTPIGISFKPPLSNSVSGYSHSRDILAAVKTLYSFFHVLQKEEITMSSNKGDRETPPPRDYASLLLNCAQSFEPFSSFLQVYEYMKMHQ